MITRIAFCTKKKLLKKNDCSSNFLLTNLTIAGIEAI